MVNTNKHITSDLVHINILDLNRQNFNYGYFTLFEEKQRYIRLYIALRSLFIIDQLHDFLEVEERNNLLKRNVSDNIQKTQIKIYKNIINNFIEGLKECINHFDNNTTLYSILSDDKVKIKSVFFATDELNFLQLIFKYFSISEKTLSVEIDDNKLPIILKGQNKYIIVDEILLRIFSTQNVNLDALFEINNSPYNCSENIDYINNLTKINYDNRYYPTQKIVDDKSIVMTVDADKSKYGISELTKQACSLSGNNINFIKTIATKFDSASSSTTEGLLRLIEGRNKRQKFKIGDNINIVDLTVNNDTSIKYLITIGDFKIMEFTYTLIHPTNIEIADEFIKYVKNPYPEGNFTALHNRLNINGNLDYIDKIFIYIKKFIKDYTFPDETKIYNDNIPLILPSFMASPPYNIQNFEAKIKNNIFTPMQLYTLFLGLNAIYLTIKDKITLEEFSENIFPDYMKVVKLDVEKFFELNKPEFNSDSHKIINILITAIKNRKLDISNKDFIKSSVSNNLDVYLNFFINLEKHLLLILKNKTVTVSKGKIIKIIDGKNLKEYGISINKNFDISKTSIKYLLSNYTFHKLEILINSISFVIDDIEKSNKSESYDKLYNKLFGMYILEFNQNNSSVGSITTNIAFNYLDVLEKSKTVPYIFSYKTLGDFGQVISFYVSNNIIKETDDQFEFGSKRKKDNTADPVNKRRQLIIDRSKQIEEQKIKINKLKQINCIIVNETEEEIKEKYNDAINRGVIIPSEKLKFFITFDRICSRISSIFNHGTIYESGVTTLSPLEIFTNYCMVIDSSTIPEAALVRSLSRG